MPDPFSVVLASGAVGGQQINLTANVWNRVHTVKSGPSGTYEEVYLYIGDNASAGGNNFEVIAGKDTSVDSFGGQTDSMGLVLVIPGIRFGSGVSVFVKPAAAQSMVALLTINRHDGEEP
jgi:hypothetical protein